MRKVFPLRGLIFFWSIYFIAVASAYAQIEVMTFNIRYANSSDGENHWDYRKSEIASLILEKRPEVVGIQEGLLDQVKYLDSALSVYRYVGVGREDGALKGEFVPIFYDTTRFRLLATKTFWLSTTPHEPSIGWDAALPRITTYAALVSIQNSDTLHVFNCHYDHMGSLARQESSKLIINLINTLGLQQKPIVVMGDFNCAPHEAPIQLLEPHLSDASAISQYNSGLSAGTFNGFAVGDINPKIIDYVFVQHIQVSSFSIITEKRQNGSYLSDHFPILVSLFLDR
jgi:endonuclease/exonuclease/phosphatase family metal-dependent hydrolase